MHALQKAAVAIVAALVPLMIAGGAWLVGAMLGMAPAARPHPVEAFWLLVIGALSGFVGAWVLRPASRVERCDGAQAQLEAQREATTLATELNTKFVRSLAHDLREPIRGITNFADILLERDLPPEAQRPFIERIRAASSRAHEQIVELRAFALRSNGKADEDLVELPVLQMVTELLERYESKIDASQAEVSVDVSEAAAKVKLASTLRHVLVNLLENALKYAGDQPRITIGAEVSDGELEIRLADDGPGIDEQDCQRIFEPYERVAEHERTKPGLGIGLSICREIVSSMGGRIWAVSARELDGGMFVIRIPLPGR